MPQSLSPHQKALQLQKRIFRSLKAEAQLLLGKTPDSIRKYERENRSDFNLGRTGIQTVTKADLLEAVQKADVTFIADFHTFNQAQRTALRIMREAVETHPSWMIGLEMIPSQFQKTLDDFQEGKMSLEEFHEKISYAQEWGFPWANYAPIFEWARENKIRLIALNRPKAFCTSKETRELHERDQWAAGLITDLFYDQIQKSKRPKMIVLYGELHVGTKHLPAQLRRISRSYLKQPLSWVTIHQNEDRLFWRLAEQERELETEAIQLKKNVFCVFSSPPWAKLQSLVSWIEGGTQETSEGEQDYLSTLKGYGDVISEFLEVPQVSYETLSVFTVNQAHFLDTLPKNDLFTGEELRLIRFHITNNQRIYIPRISFAYLGSPSHNGAAELAAIHISRCLNQSENIFSRAEDDFYRLVLEAAFGFFGSLLLNPKRKCDLPRDHIKRLRDLKKGEKNAFPLEREARELAIGIVRNRPRPEFNLNSVLRKRSLAPAAMMGARFLGQILGKRLHETVLAENKEVQKLRQIFLARHDSSSSFFLRRYDELVGMISRIVTVPSKTDHL